MKAEEFRKGLMDLFYGGFVCAIIGIVLISLYPVAVVLVIAGVFAIVSSGALMIKNSLKNRE